MAAAVCQAVTALEAAEGFRYHGALASRMETSPRERDIIGSWRRNVNDHRLAQILDQEGHDPSDRDWFVATSVVQWLATNVGMGVLEGAGFYYDFDGLKRRKLTVTLEGHDVPVAPVGETPDP